MRKWIVSEIMQKPSEPIHLDFVNVELFSAILVDASKHPTCDVASSETVGKSRIVRTRIHKMRETELTDVVESLENRSGNNVAF
jgi:hypothetical protein